MASYNSNQDAAAQKAEETKLFGQQKAGEAHQATKVVTDPPSPQRQHLNQGSLQFVQTLLESAFSIMLG